MRSSKKPKNLKQNNTRVILDLLRDHETVSVAEISMKIGLSKTTVKKLVNSLVAQNLAASVGKGESTMEGGKKPELYRFHKNYGYVLSFHITPDSIIAVTTDLLADITYYSKNSIQSDRSLPSVIDQLAAMIRSISGMKEANGGEKLIGIVVALPGLVDPAAGISIYSPHYHSWGRNVPFLALLRENLGDVYDDVPVFIGNVNRYQAIAEQGKGIGGGVDNFLIVDAIEDGLGAGVILHGKLIDGNQSLAGEIGHMTLDSREGPICNCGNKGCFEALVSAKRILSLAWEAHRAGRDSRLFREMDPEADPKELTLAAVCESAASGDALSRELVADAVRWFVLGFANIIMVVDPDLIVVQGVYVKAGDFFLDRLREGLKNIGLPNVEKRIRIEHSVMGEERGVIGGAVAVISEFFTRRLLF